MPAQPIFSRSRAGLGRTALAVGALAVAGLPAPGAGDAAPAARSPVERALEAHVRFLADDLLAGREAGTEGYEIAARYVAARFRELGLEPAGDAGGYLQSVPFRRNAIDSASAVLRLHRGGASEDLAWKEDFLMWGDAAREETSVNAPVVFVGYGVVAPELGWNDYAGLDAAGKIVLQLSGAPPDLPPDQRAYYSSGRTKREVAVAQGAVGILGLRTRVDQARSPWERTSAHAGRPGLRWVTEAGEANGHQPELLGEALVSPDGARRLFEGAPTSLDQVLDAAETGRVEGFALPLEATLARRTSFERLESSNVAGLLPGSDPDLAGETVVLTAHLDHVGVRSPVDGDEIYNGAYDNAMGVAALIEAARALVESGEPPRRSVLFLAVTGEEKGLQGSDYFAEHPTVPAGGLVANVNLDMPLFLYPLADLVAFGAEHSTLEGPAGRAAAAVGFALSPDPFPEEVIFVRSDQYSFVRRGVPAVFLFSGFASSDPAVDGEAAYRDFLQTHYHRPSDDLELPIDWPSAARFVEVNVRLVREVADADQRPRWKEGDFFGQKFGAGQ